jgi:hypothetical protein
VIVPIVEGYSEVESVPVLLRRYFADTNVYGVEVARPIRVKRNRVVKEGELEKVVELARRQYPEGKAVLVVLDADEDCPADLGPALLGRANSAAYGQFHCAVVLPKTELESWFVAAVASLRGHRGICADAGPPADPEGIADAKHWLTRQMTNRTYVETDDQPAFAERFDFQQAYESCRSFRKFDKEVRAILLSLSGPAAD